MSIQISQRDIEVLKWINCFGFVTAPQIARKFGVCNYTAYQRLRRLVRRDCLNYEQIFHHAPGVYFVTLLGAHLIESPLPPVKRISLGTYRHDLKVVDLALVLASHHKATFITEREIRQQKGLHGVGQEGHICDGILLFENKKVAIEVELTAKGKSRCQKIINNYIAQLSYKEIWYFCGSDGIANLIKKYAKKASFIKVELLDDFLNPKEVQNGQPSKVPIIA